MAGKTRDGRAKRTKQKPTVEKPRVGQEKKGDKSSTYFVLIVVGALVTVAAVMYANEDIQSRFDSLIQKFVAPSNQSVDSMTTSDEKVRVNKEDSRSNTGQKVKEESSGSRTDKNVEPNLQKENIVSSTTATSTQVPASKEKTKKEYSKKDITNAEDFKIRKKLDQADDYLANGDLDKAMKLFDEIISKNPNSPRAVFGKGQVTDQLADQRRSNTILEEAIALMDRALRLDNVPPVLLKKIGFRITQRQRFRGWSGKSVLTWKYMIEKIPDDVRLRQQLGVSYLLFGDNEQARQVFTEVLELYPNDGFSLVHLGFIIQSVDNNPNTSIPLLRKGIDTGEEGTVDGRFYFQLGDAYVRTNQREKADEVFSLGHKKGLFRSQYQRSLYNVDNLTAQPWWTPEQTTYEKYFKLLEDNWQTIRDEGMAQFNSKTGNFEPEAENLREKGDWKQFTLYSRGQQHKDNCVRTPTTCSLIETIPDAKSCKRGQVKFSVMQPGVHVWPHCGPTNCRLRAHLGLVVPEGPRIRVKNDIRVWREGKFIIFDDSFEHEVWHDGTEVRMVLIIDFWHPELTSNQKQELSPI